ncbi:hypothetical protein [Streptomyces sp. NPDC001135]
MPAAAWAGAFAELRQAAEVACGDTGCRPFWPRHSSQADRQRKGGFTVGVSKVSSRPTIWLMSKPSMPARDSLLDRYAYVEVTKVTGARTRPGRPNGRTRGRSGFR